MTSARRRRLWSLADQIASSLVNVALIVLVASRVPATTFGAFALLYGYYVLALQLSQAAFSEPLLVRFPRSHEDSAEALKLSSGAAAVLGALAAILLIPLSKVMFGGLSPAAMVLAVALPLLLAQDAIRMGFLAGGRPHLAFVADLVWGIAQCLLTLVALTISTELVWLMLGWVSGAVITLVVSITLGRVVPTPSLRCVKTWIQQFGDLARPFFVEAAALAGSMYTTLFFVEAFAGLAAVAALRAGQTIFGPANVISNAVRVVAIAEMSRLASSRPQRMTKPVILVTISLSLVGLATGALALMLPEGVGQALFGQTWPLLVPLLTALTVQRVASGASMGPLTALRGLQRVRPLFHMRIATALCTVLAGAVGAITGGAAGAAWGLAAVAIGNCAAAGALYAQAHIAVRATNSPIGIERVSREAT